MADDTRTSSRGRHARHAQTQENKAQAPISQGVGSAATMRAHKLTQRHTSHPHTRSPRRSQEPRNKVHLAIVLCFAAVVLVLICAGFWMVSNFFFAKQSTTHEVVSGQTVTITVPEGATGSDIAKLLVDNGVISDATSFLKEVQAQQSESTMKSGTYDIVTGTDVSEIVKLLVSGPNSNSNRLTIPEGYTVQKIASLVESQFGIAASDFIAQAKASNYVSDYSFLSEAKDDSLEGFLFASTYDVGSTTPTADSIIRLMLDQYKAQVASLDFMSAAANMKQKYGVDFTQYDFLTLASIIEREAVNDDDRYKVSSVFYNRLKDGMSLDSDATMGYVTGGEVTADDLKQASPYNTYLNKGLTPTPICSPSMASIQAALNPADTDYYYFLIIENGSYSNHTFSTTYDEHVQAIAKAQADQAGN